MRTSILLFSALLTGFAASAQTVASFDTLSLASPNTFYVNYSAPGADVGFDDGLAHFPCYYDTAWGGLWSEGFAYSNMTDSINGDYTNLYSAKAAIGQGATSNYVAVNCMNPVTYEPTTKLFLTGAAVGKKVNGFFITNSTYAYNVMKDGATFGTPHPFGGATGTDPDWFKLTIKGFSGGTLKSDSVEFYLADFRFAGTSNDYILKTWQWVNLLPLGNVDSLQFFLSSTDNNSAGMLTPCFFCIDNFTTQETVPPPPVNSVNNVNATMAKVYPNPASDKLMIDLFDHTVKTASIIDIAGRTITTVDCAAHTEINTADLTAGIYLLQLTGSNGTVTTRFQKK